MSVPILQDAVSDEWLDIGLPAGASGGAIYMAGEGDSSARTSVGAPRVDNSEWSVEGVHGTFVETHGFRDRTIKLEGHLRVTWDALETIKTQRDRFVMADSLFVFVNEGGSVYADCHLEQFEIDETRLRTLSQAGDLEVIVPYSIVLRQLNISEQA